MLLYPFLIRAPGILLWRIPHIMEMEIQNLTYHPSGWSCSTNKFAIRFRTEEVESKEDVFTAIPAAIISDLEGDYHVYHGE